MSTITVMGNVDLFKFPKMAVVGFGGKSIRMVYENKQFNESFAKVYNADTTSNRLDFLTELSRNGFVVPTQSVVAFSVFNLDDSILYVEYV